MRKLIINADEFGLSKEINLGIVKAFEEGVISNTTIMINLPHAMHALALAKKDKRIKVGLHLNLTYGKPISNPASIPSLVDAKGEMHNWTRFIPLLQLGRIRKKEIEIEINAQLNRLKELRSEVTHVDGHSHIHMHPVVLEILIDACKKANIKAIRWSYEPLISPIYDNLISISNVKRYMVSSFSLICKPLIIKNKILTNSHMIGGLQTGCRNPLRTFTNYLHLVKEDNIEMLCHPGYTHKNESRISSFLRSYNSQREEELKALCSDQFKNHLNSRRIRLISYADL